MDGSRGERERFGGRVEVVSGATGRRRWPEHVKARIVRESFAPGASVSALARHYGMAPQQLTGWRRAARDGLLALPGETTEAPDFVPLAVADDRGDAGSGAAGAGVEIVAGRVTVRLPEETDAERIAAVAAALEARL